MSYDNWKTRELQDSREYEDGPEEIEEEPTEDEYERMYAENVYCRKCKAIQ